MNEDDHDDNELKCLMTPVEVLSLATLGIIELLRCQSVCFYPGPAVPPHPDDITDFLGCLPYVGKCTALIFCAPHLKKSDMRNYIQKVAIGETSLNPDLDECVGIEPGFELIWRDELLFLPARVADTSSQPSDQFWAHFCILKISGRGMKLLLLHLGMTGDQAQKFFLEPHGIQPICTVANPGQ